VCRELTSVTLRLLIASESVGFSRRHEEFALAALEEDMIRPLTVSDWPTKTHMSLESFDCEFWCNFVTHCLSGHITVGISLGRCVMNGVISDHTAHI
jgi:hypothetical protein